MNTVVCSLNWEEDMSRHVLDLQPDRWKVFQVLVLEQENAGGPGDLRDARPLRVTGDQYWSFVRRHQSRLREHEPTHPSIFFGRAHPRTE
jgi:radical S-adenosyl methionine domain-containing protein 2